MEFKQNIKIVENGDTFNIEGVEIFEITGEEEKGILFDTKFVNKVIKTHNERRDEKWFLPTIFIGHNGFRDEKESVGFMDNMRKKGKKVLVDFMNIAISFKDEMQKYPYRSVEIFGEQVTGLALLGSNAPYFENAPLIFEKEEVEAQKYFWTLDLLEATPQDVEEEKLLFNNESNMDFAKEKAELEAKFEKERAEDQAKFQAELSEKAERLATFEKKETLSECDSKVTEFFSKNEKLTTSNDEANSKIAAFASELSEDSRAEFFSILDSIIVFEAGKEEGSNEGGEDDKEKTEAELEAEASKEAIEEAKESKEGYRKIFNRILSEKKASK